MFLYWIVTGLFLGISISGVLFPAAIYPSADLRAGLAANDWVNLVVCVPLLCGLPWLDRRGSLPARLFLPGALLFVIYNAAAYAAAMVPYWPFWPGLVTAGLGIAGLVAAFRRLDLADLRLKMSGRSAERWAGGVLAAMGLLFFLRGLGQLIQGAAGTERAVAIADMIVTPLWAAGGLLLWRRLGIGFALGAAGLFQAALLFTALLLFFFVQPLVSGGSFRTADFAVILGMSLVGFVPLVFFMRGAAERG